MLSTIPSHLRNEILFHAPVESLLESAYMTDEKWKLFTLRRWKNTIINPSSFPQLHTSHHKATFFNSSSSGTEPSNAPFASPVLLVSPYNASTSPALSPSLVHPNSTMFPLYNSSSINTSTNSYSASSPSLSPILTDITPSPHTSTLSNIINNNIVNNNINTSNNNNINNNLSPLSTPLIHSYGQFFSAGQSISTFDNTHPNVNNNTNNNFINTNFINTNNINNNNVNNSINNNTSSSSSSSISSSPLTTSTSISSLYMNTNNNNINPTFNNIINNNNNNNNNSKPVSSRRMPWKSIFLQKLVQESITALSSSSDYDTLSELFSVQFSTLSSSLSFIIYFLLSFFLFLFIYFSLALFSLAQNDVYDLLFRNTDTNTALSLILTILRGALPCLFHLDLSRVYFILFYFFFLFY